MFKLPWVISKNIAPHAKYQVQNCEQLNTDCAEVCTAGSLLWKQVFSGMKWAPFSGACGEDFHGSMAQSQKLGLVRASFSILVTAPCAGFVFQVSYWKLSSPWAVRSCVLTLCLFCPSIETYFPPSYINSHCWSFQLSGCDAALWLYKYM